MADDGQAPPLYCKANLALQWGSLYGTEHLDPSGLRKWKATAVRLLSPASMFAQMSMPDPNVHIHTTRPHLPLMLKFARHWAGTLLHMAARQ